MSPHNYSVHDDYLLLVDVIGTNEPRAMEALQRLRDAASGPSAVDRSDAVNLVRNLREYGDNAKDKITMAGLLCLFDAVEGMDAALRGPNGEAAKLAAQWKERADDAGRLARAVLDGASPSESPMAWMVFCDNHPLGFDYMVFPDELRADTYALEQNAEAIPLYRASAFKSAAPQAPAVTGNARPADAQDIGTEQPVGAAHHATGDTNTHKEKG